MYSSGFLWFPSERTLRDYTNYFTNQPGFQPDLNEQLAKEADVKSLAENKKYVALLENHNLQQCLTNGAALRLQGSISLDPVRGNCREKRYLDTDEPAAIDSTPLPRRKRRKLKL